MNERIPWEKRQQWAAAADQLGGEATLAGTVISEMLAEIDRLDGVLESARRDKQILSDIATHSARHAEARNHDGSD